ncbi:MAG: winged helix-turn-helix domain-containing protein [Moorellales bacterium]
MRLRYKVWLEHEELGKAFGEGPLEMLERVESSGSLRRAAREMGMSYNKAWYLVQKLERALGFPLLERRAGGADGGGSAVTPQARELMRRYRRFREEVARELEEAYRRHFGDFPWPQSSR